MMHKIYKTPDLSFLYPDDWMVETIDNTLSIYEPLKGVGHLQFSSYKIVEPTKINLKNEQEDFVRERYKSLEIILEKNSAFTNDKF
jgi:hypothetical protein